MSCYLKSLRLLPEYLLIPSILLAVSTASSDPYMLAKYVVIALGALYLAFVKGFKCTILCPIFAVYLTSILITTVHSVNPAISVMGVYGNYFNGIVPMIMFWCAYQLGIGCNKDTAIKVSLWSLVVVSLIGIAQSFGYLLTYGIYYGRIYSTIGSPIFLASLYALLVPIILFENKIALIVSLIALFLTYCRAGAMGVMVGSIVNFTLNLKTSLLKMSVMVGLFVVLLAGAWIQIDHRKSDVGRVVMAQIAWDSFKKHPIVGVGAENYYREFESSPRKQALWDKMGSNYFNVYCHNSVLESLTTTGLVGSFGLLFMLSAIVYFLYNTANFNLISGLVGIFIYSMFQPTPLMTKVIFSFLLGTTMTEQYIDKYNKYIYYLIFSVVVICSLTVIMLYMNCRNLSYATKLWDPILLRETIGRNLAFK